MLTMSTLAIVFGVVGILQVLLLWRILRAARSWEQVEQRVAHFGKVLTLLTETTETGMSAIAAELHRRSPLETVGDDEPAGQPAGIRAPTTGAARPARSRRPAAAEAQLRTYLDQHAVTCPCASCAARSAHAEAEARA